MPEDKSNRKKFEDLFKHIPKLEPCEFCGRLVLIGPWCCKAAEDDYKNTLEKNK